MEKDCNCHSSEECSCGAGCDCHGEELPVLYLTFDDSDEEVACDVLGIFPVDGKTYIAVVPQNEEEEDEVLIYRYEENEDGEDPMLDDIESEEEYERVSAEFFEIFFEEDEESEEN